LPFSSNVARDFELPGRSEAFGMRVMAATSHPLAMPTALDVLRRRGADGRRDGLAAGW
jgi:hypothetical protein